MVASTLQQPRREWFDILDDWILNATALSLWDWSGLLLFPTAYLAIGGSNLLVLLSLRRGTPTGWRLVILRALISLQRQCQRLLTLWVILFFYFGVLSLKGDFIRWCQLGGLWSFVALHGVPSLLSVLCLGNLNLLV